jgi:2'-5' RNA ligase/transposase-like protein
MRMPRWLHSFLYGSPTALVAVPPTQEIAASKALAEAQGRTSLIFDSHIMTEAASSKNPQAVSLAWDEGRAFGYNVAPQSSWMGMTPRERKETLLSIFLANPWASNCIDTIALYITSGGYTIEPRVDKPDERQRDDIEAFLQRINEDWDFDQYVYDQLTDEDIFGECFTEFTMKGGKPYQLFPIDNLTMDTEHDKYGRVTRYKQQLTSTSKINYLNPKTIIRWWNPHKRAKVDPFSPLEGVQDAILLDKKMTNWSTTFFQKGAKFPFSVEGISDQDEADRFLTWFKANYTGEKNAQTPFVAWGGATLKPMGKGSIDIDFDKGLDRQQAIVLANFHVPPSIACISETGNRLTDMSDSQRKILQYIACDPRRRRFFEKFNYRLIHPFFGTDYYVSSRYADFRDDESLAKVADTRIRNGSMLIDEVRQEMGKDAYPDGVGQVPVIVVTRDVVPIERLAQMSDEQARTVQQAADAADLNNQLLKEKVDQAKNPPESAPLQKGQQGVPSNATMPPKTKKQPEEPQESASDRPAVVQQRTGMMVAFLLDPKTAQQLAIPGGEPADDLHITLAYLGDTADFVGSIDHLVGTIDLFARTMQPLAGRVSGIGRFITDGEDVTPVYASVDMEGLQSFHDELIDHLSSLGYDAASNFAYNPHITLAYIGSDASMPVEDIANVPLHFDKVCLAIGDERHFFKLGSDSLPPSRENHEEQETHQESRETDDVRPGQDEGQGAVALSEIDEPGHKEAGTGGSASVADQRKAELTSWIASLFQAMKARGEELAPSLDHAASFYAFNDQEQAALAQKLAEVNIAAQQFSYNRDMVAVGLAQPTEEGLFSKVGDVLSWGREQVTLIASTMKDMLSNFVSGLAPDAKVAEAVGGWIDRYADYKAPQIANVTWGTGANDGSMQAIEDIVEAAKDPSKAVSTDQVRVKVVPSYSSADFCADYAGKDYSIPEYLQLGISWPAHPNCRHSIEMVRKDGDEA